MGSFNVMQDPEDVLWDLYHELCDDAYPDSAIPTKSYDEAKKLKRLLHCCGGKMDVAEQAVRLYVRDFLRCRDRYYNLKSEEWPTIEGLARCAEKLAKDARRVVARMHEDGYTSVEEQMAVETHTFDARLASALARRMGKR